MQPSAKVIKPFKGVRDGEIYPVEFAVGDTVTGKLADVAISQGWAAIDDEKPAEPQKVTRRARKS